MKLSDAKNKYVLSTKIDLGDGDFVELREPTLKEVNEINRAPEDGRMDVIIGLSPDCLIDHSFEDDGGNKADCKVVCEALKESGSLFIAILTQWVESSPFQGRLGKKPK
jgi:hypothetical protein